MNERLMFAPLEEVHLIDCASALQGAVAEHAINSMPLHPGPAPEDIRRKGE